LNLGCEICYGIVVTTVDISIRKKICSSAVEQPAFNGFVLGSNPNKFIK
jgi:hypothetical protein